ncbi:MAG: STAS-like domain-containing protein [Treponema sp.]|nr:STAS-like domain-containing protein [Treponema sp.]
MVLQIHNFGDILMSRPAGKEAFLMAKAYILGQPSPEETITLDFSDVKVLAPSWADEFISNLKSTFPNQIDFLNTENESVKESLKWVS